MSVAIHKKLVAVKLSGYLFGVVVSPKASQGRNFPHSSMLAQFIRAGGHSQSADRSVSVSLSLSHGPDFVKVGGTSSRMWGIFVSLLGV